MSEKLYKQRYRRQRDRATRVRGIQFYLTYEQWRAWWGDDIQYRGKGANDLCMCRYNDIGPYAVWNIYKDTFGNNVRTAQLGKPRSEEIKRKMSESRLGRKDSPAQLQAKLKPCSIEGVVYPSMSAAAEPNGVTIESISNWIKSDRKPNCYSVPRVVS